MDQLLAHQSEVVNRTWNFAGRLKTEQDHQQNAMVGLASEAGELLDVGKKMWFHSEKPADFFREKIVLELGDVLYYFLKVLDVFGLTLDEVIRANRAKLASRHPELGEVTERFPDGYIR
jgi:phosphoribosyl-ATP pyrophosphohydrolase